MTHDDLRRLIALRASGWNIKALAEEFRKDRTTIRFHLEKYSVQPFVVVFRKEKTGKKPIVFNFGFEKTNPGKTYREYMKCHKPSRSYVEDFTGRVYVKPHKSTMQDIY